MTIKELMDYLAQFPPETMIITTLYSDYIEVEKDQFTFLPKGQWPEERTGRIYQKRTCIRPSARVTDSEGDEGSLRTGYITDYDERSWPKEETPIFVDILHIDGN